MRAYSAAILMVVFGCDQPALPAIDSGQRADGSVDAGPSSPCARDADCSDGLYCTGEERCRPGEPGADARGCVTLTAPCAGEACDEANDVCGACENPDVDGDGHDSNACGGDDCDDHDPLRFVGNPEICDLMNHDEDC